MTEACPQPSSPTTDATADLHWARLFCPRWRLDPFALDLSHRDADRRNRLIFAARNDGSRCTLRLLSDARSMAEVRTYLAWLGHLREYGVGTLQPLLGLDGEVVQSVRHGGRTRHAIAFEWIDGIVWSDLAATDITRGLLNAFGRTVGLVHQASAAMDIPSWFTGHHYDGRWIGDCLSSLIEGQRSSLSSHATALIRELNAVGKSREEYGLVAVDLAAHNTVVAHGSPHLIDMLSFGWGYFVADLQHAILVSNQESEQQAILDGYGEIRPVPASFKRLFELLRQSREVGFHWFDQGADR